MSVLNRPTLPSKLAWVGCIVIFSAGQMFGQIDAPAASPSPSMQPASATPKSADANTTVLQFEAFLREEAKNHEQFLKDSLEQLKWFLGVIVILGGGILTWLNIKSRKEIRAQVNERFKVSLDAVVADRLSQFNEFLEANKRQIDESTKKTDKVREEQLKLTDRFAELASDLTFAFHVLDQKLTGKQWEAARRTAMKRLEGQRRLFPDLRGAAILLGRLHKLFGEYGSAVNVLTETMQERDKRNLVQNTEYADLLYNRACYRNRAAEKAAENRDSIGAAALREQAWLDLNRAVRIDPNNKADAFDDGDFDTLWNKRDREKSALGKIDIAAFRKSAGGTNLWENIKAAFKERH